jgi:hypothetical protein
VRKRPEPEYTLPAAQRARLGALAAAADGCGHEDWECREMQALRTYWRRLRDEGIRDFHVGGPRPPKLGGGRALTWYEISRDRALPMDEADRRLLREFIDGVRETAADLGAIP